MPTPLDLYQSERPRLFRAAYRMLGSVREAEDVLQDAWLRWQAAPHPEIAEPAGYLRRIVARLALDQVRSAHARRIRYVGPWLPEPLVEELSAAAPGLPDDDLSTAFLLLLERLSPVERAVFVLRESLGFDYAEIAGIVGKSEANCRQIGRRARQRLDQGGRTFPSDPAEHQRLLDGFLRAVREGDVDGLVALLADDVEAWGDGGGKVASAPRVIAGRDDVARLFLGLARKLPADAEFRPMLVNGLPGVVLFYGDVLQAVLQLDTRGGRIAAVYSLFNPDKLPPLSRRGPRSPS